MGTLNAFFWLVYGLALMDMVIFLPNFCGFLLSMFQILLCVIFPRAEYGDQQQMTEQLVDDANLESNGDMTNQPSERNESLEML